MIIDAHTHGLNGKYLDPIAKAGGAWAKRAMDRLMVRAGGGQTLYLDMAFRVEMLDRYGFDYQVVTPTPFYTSFCPGEDATRLELARRINDNMSTIGQESKGRLIPVGTIPLRGLNDASLKEMERAILSLGLKGIFVESNIAGKPLDDPEFEPFWAKAAAMDIPVWIHPVDRTDSTSRPYEARFDLMHNFGWPFETTLALAGLVFSGLMEKYPKLKVVNHHLGGGMIPFFMGRTMETYAPQNQPKLIGKTLPKPLTEYFSLFFYDTAVGGSTAACKCCYEAFGAEQMVFATDAPFGPRQGEGRLETYPGVIKAMGLSAAQNEKIMSGNIKKLLKMK